MTKDLTKKYIERIQKLESENSDLKHEKEVIQAQNEEYEGKLRFYQMISDFTFGWELWFDPDGIIKYCSPSCFDLTGYTSNQIISSSGIDELLVYGPDQSKFNDFIKRSMDQMLVNVSLEFRILTRTKQLRWCIINVRGVYDKQGKYLGVRASIQDITRLKRAMGQIQEMGAVKELEERTKERLQTEINSKDRELISFLLQLSQKNEILATVLGMLRNLEFEKSKSSKNQVQDIINMLVENSSQKLDWASVENQVEKLHPGFLDRLQTTYPSISKKDKILSAYLRLELTSKEISGLLNITPKSVEIARVRLRKKFNITSKIRLTKFLEQI